MVMFLVPVVAVTATLTSCGVPERGLTGVKLEADGRLTAVLAWCPGRAPDGITLHTGEREPELSIEFNAPELPGTYAEAPLTELPQGWTSTSGMPALDPRRDYRVYGWTRDNSSSTRGVHFTLTRLRSHTSGGILIQEYDETSDSWVDVSLTTDEFRRAVDRVVGC